MKIVPVLAIIVIIWILGQAAASETSVGSDTRTGLRLRLKSSRRRYCI